MGAEWLKPCAYVEDWGCGMGYFRKFVKPGQRYIGIDGTASPFADFVTDLAADYAGPGDSIGPEGIFMRGVIEHDYRWAKILENAVASFTCRMCLVLFTPMAEGLTGFVCDRCNADGDIEFKDGTTTYVLRCDTCRGEKWVPGVNQLAFNEEIGVPDLSFSMQDLEPYIGPHLVRYEDVKSDTGYGGERVIYLEKK